MEHTCPSVCTVSAADGREHWSSVSVALADSVVTFPSRFWLFALGFCSFFFFSFVLDRLRLAYDSISSSSESDFINHDLSLFSNLGCNVFICQTVCSGIEMVSGTFLNKMCFLCLEFTSLLR